MTASELFAISQGQHCMGNEKCHWCGAPCDRSHIHDDPPPIPFVRSQHCALFPTQPYTCIGCRLWRRQRVTVHYHNGALKDRQCAFNHSWWMLPDGAWALELKDSSKLYEMLLKPPSVFCLSLRTQPVPNYLQLALVNVLPGCSAETVVAFTCDNVRHRYCVQELEHALLTGNTDGMQAGVRALIEALGPLQVAPPIKLVDEEPSVKNGHSQPKRGRGRPTEEEKNARQPHRTVRASGTVAYC